jgi:tetratricopeptide (TPR) repeat protein
MNRFRGLCLVIALGAGIPSTLQAQAQFKESKYTKDADKFIALAMTRSEKADRQNYYRQALGALQEGFTKEPQNAKIWFTAGQIQVGLSNYLAADSAFDKAVQMHPESATDADAEREAGWMQAFNEGVELMDAQQYDQALALLLAAETLYGKRPEGLLNIGSIYANKGDNQNAEEAFRKAAEAAQGELYAKLDTAQQAQWRSFVEMSTLNIAQIRGARGVDHFNADQLDEAAAAFKSAFDVNPYSRDYLFNFVQARYAKASKLEEQLETTPAALTELKPQLVELYTGIVRDVPKVREFDPTNENIQLIHARAIRRTGELNGDTLAAREAALKILQANDDIPVEIMELAISMDQNTATINGKIRNKKLNPGTPVTVKLTLLGYKGDTIGQMTVTVNAGATGEAAELVTFQQTGNVTGQVAGWKYEVSNT